MKNDPFVLCINSPIGPLSLFGDETGLVRIEHDVGALVADTPSDDLLAARDQLDEYFAGDRETFDLRLAPKGTPRRVELWEAMQTIPFGTWWSYQKLAERAQSSARAIGSACANNPIPIIIPCHRVLNADGRLGHYSFANGPETKHALLCLEGSML